MGDRCQRQKSLVSGIPPILAPLPTALEKRTGGRVCYLLLLATNPGESPEIEKHVSILNIDADTMRQSPIWVICTLFGSQYKSRRTYHYVAKEQCIWMYVLALILPGAFT